jgi:hypothetical protein
MLSRAGGSDRDYSSFSIGPLKNREVDFISMQLFRNWELRHNDSIHAKLN